MSTPDVPDIKHFRFQSAVGNAEYIDFASDRISAAPGAEVDVIAGNVSDLLLLLNSVTHKSIYDVIPHLTNALAPSQSNVSDYRSDVMHFPVHLYWQKIEDGQTTYRLTIVFPSPMRHRALRLAYTLLRLSDGFAFTYGDIVLAIDLSYALLDGYVIATVDYDSGLRPAYNAAQNDCLARDITESNFVTLLSAAPVADFNLSLMARAVAVGRYLQGSPTLPIALSSICQLRAASPDALKSKGEDMCISII